MAEPRGTRPDDSPKVQMTREWKNLVLRTLEQRGWSVDRLAREVEISRSLAYRIFPADPVDNEIWSSSVVPEVCEALGLPPPMEPTEVARNPEDRKILELVRSMPEDMKLSLIRFIESLLSRKG